MRVFWLPLLLAGIYLALFILPLGFVLLWRKRLAEKRRSPLSHLLLREPGESLHNELDDTVWEMLFYLVIFPVAPLFFYALHLTQSYFGGMAETNFRIAVSVLTGMGISVFLLFRVMGLAQRINKLRLGYEGEVAVAQELNQLMREGAVVFHDVPAEGFNIDHVIVGSNGVFAVETKSRMKPNRDRGAEDAHVVFDGKSLCFPGWTEAEPLDQAARQAKWFAQWLSSAIGEKVEVKPVLVLPGWFVDRKGLGNVIVFNGKNPLFLLNKITFSTPLSEEQVKRIAHQLEQRCRDVEPRLYRKRERIATV